MFKLGNIFMRIIENTFSFQTITASPPGFLVIIFNALRNIVVNNKPDIWLIDPERKHLNVFDSNGLREVPTLTLPEYGFEVKPDDLF